VLPMNTPMKALFRRTFAASMTPAEREAAIASANEKMKAYYTNRPPIEKLMNSKRRSKIRDRENYIISLIRELSYISFHGT
jgi:hypothetical protein